MRHSDHHYLTTETKDVLLQWVQCTCPRALRQQEFLHGLFFFCNEAIARAVLQERRETFDRVRQQLPHNQ